MIPVRRAPATLEAGARLHLLAVETADSPLRESARSQIRATIVDALAQTLGLPASALTIRSIPGEAPALILPDGSQAGLSISHSEGLSIAAIALDGAVGVDLMRIIGLADQQALARDYLGPDATARLAALPAHEQARAFAQVWTAHEAKLKCLGLPLTEWSEALETKLSRCAVQELALPEAWAGSLALVA
ncbi:4'-phosphopantetheinyl transferase family protein [Niveibacterium terrae]|uniref:4'-phosphopantetheinyl transferase family protein n=1 Tax=Niveibacterium terrae TaxID=3373598 RepID=UPI003A8D2879